MISALLKLLFFLNLSILHIGDSHVAPGITTQILADSLKAETHIYAIGGKTYNYFISNSSTVIAKIEKYKPTLVIISLGTNDCFGGVRYNFKSQVEKLIDIILNQDSTIKIILTSPPDNKHHEAMVRCGEVLDSCQKHNVYYCDITNNDNGYKNHIAKDRVHYSWTGYKKLGLVIYEFIKNLNIIL
jgi:hypothetical protein